jgi:hypothetical protein
MATLPVPDVCKIVVRFTLADAAYTLGFHAKKTDFTSQDQIDLADAVDAAVAAWTWNTKPDTEYYVRTDVYDLRTSDGPISINNDGADQGEASADTLPPTVCAVITERTAARGRSGRGRLYWPVGSEASMTDGVISGGRQASILSEYDDIVTAITTEGFTHVLVSRQIDGVQRDPPVAIPIISREIRSGHPGYQRRRSIRP